MRLKMTTTAILMALMTLSFSVTANNLIFKCDIKNNKQVRLYKNLTYITYSFGKINTNPDIELKRKKEQLDIKTDNPSGRYLTNSIGINNGIYSYRLTTSVDRIADEQVPITSLTVMKYGKDLTSLGCIKGSEVGALIAIDD